VEIVDWDTTPPERRADEAWIREYWNREFRRSQRLHSDDEDGVEVDPAPYDAFIERYLDRVTDVRCHAAFCGDFPDDGTSPRTDADWRYLPCGLYPRPGERFCHKHGGPGRKGGPDATPPAVRKDFPAPVPKPSYWPDPDEGKGQWLQLTWGLGDYGRALAVDVCATLAWLCDERIVQILETTDPELAAEKRELSRALWGGRQLGDRMRKWAKLLRVDDADRERE